VRQLVSNRIPPLGRPTVNAWIDRALSGVTIPSRRTNFLIVALLVTIAAAPRLSVIGEVAVGQPQWYWRADLETGENLVAHGLGTDKPTNGAAIDAKSAWKDGRWSVVLSRPLKAKGADNVKLTPGKKASFGVTIWEGSNRERGDLRSYSQQWHELTLDQ